eukprot:scaffold26463_cov25-Prasinocladus_malaysianus.AAC.6
MRARPVSLRLFFIAAAGPLGLAGLELHVYAMYELHELPAGLGVYVCAGHDGRCHLRQVVLDGMVYVEPDAVGVGPGPMMRST